MSHVLDTIDPIKVSDEIFADIKQAAIKVWSSYENEHYRSEKLGRVQDLKNLGDNWSYIVGMFDLPNKQRLLSFLELRESVSLIEPYIENEKKAMGVLASMRITF